MWFGAYIVHPHDSMRIDQNVPTKLSKVFSKPPKLCTSEHQPQVLPGVRRPESVPPTRFPHSVGPVKPSLPINQNWPLQFVRQGITAGQIGRVKSDDRDRHFSRIEEFRFLPQLRQMMPARQSTKMTVKNEEKPTTAKITFAQAFASRRRQIKVCGGLTQHNSCQKEFGEPDSGKLQLRSVWITLCFLSRAVATSPRCDGVM